MFGKLGQLGQIASLLGNPEKLKKDMEAMNQRLAAARFVGEAGGGGYEFVPDPAVCARAFARALGAQGDVVAAGVEVVIELAEGVELVRFVGREETLFSRDGLLVSLADMIHGARRLVVAELGRGKHAARPAQVDGQPRVGLDRLGDDDLCAAGRAL